MKNKYKRLPDPEFRVMKAIWQFQRPIALRELSEAMESESQKGAGAEDVHRVLTALAHLSERGFLNSIRIGNDRYYHALVSERDYRNAEVGSFLLEYLKNPLTRLVRV
ncbi:MAG: BlaI/MecI/CopY family transcriptional regulator [Bacillota bacterium]|nr:BlaI/MecI/CopY family transcriptional regulator [Bacillota bacterium]